MSNVTDLEAIAAELRKLQLTSPASRAELDAWDLASRNFVTWLHATYPHVALPAQVMHFLHDADLRIKDAAYRQAQDELLSGIIADLERGIVPTSGGLNIAIHPRWLGAVAILMIMVLYLVTR